MKPKRQRMLLVGAACVALAGAAALGFSAMGDTMVFFYGPTDARTKGVEPGQAIRLGGLVEKGSVARQSDGLTIAFEVTDGTTRVPVSYTGIVPDLFREGQGVVAEGAFDARGHFTAKTLLARHDENYMPREVADTLKAQGHWQASYGQKPKAPAGT
jgi:cytochrome c-type biogenesis protein CcmE